MLEFCDCLFYLFIHFTFLILSAFPKFILFVGGGNGNPLQYSCLENPRDGGAWSAAVYGAAQSWLDTNEAT